MGIVLTVLLLTLAFTGTVQEDLQAQSSTPAKPLLVAIGRSTEVVLYWADLDDDSITGWQYQYGISSLFEPPSSYGNWTDIPIPSGTDAADLYTYTVTSLTTTQWLHFKIRAVNSNGNGTASDANTARLYSKITTLTMTPDTVTEGDSGFTDVTLTLTLSEAAPSGGVSFEIALTSGISTATARTPVVAPCNALTSRPNDDICRPPGDDEDIFVAEGTMTKTATYRIVGDTRDENHEVVYLHATAPNFSFGIARLVIMDDDGATDTPVPPTATHTHTNTPAPSDTPVPPTATHTHTNTPAPSDTPVPPTATHTHTNTPAPSDTPVPPTATHTHTNTPAPSDTPVPPTATHTHTNTPAPSDTPVPPTATHTHTNTPAPSDTPVPPTATHTHTNTPAPSDTPVPPTATHTHTNTPAPSDTPVPPTATHTHTNTPAPSDTPVPPTATHTHTNTPAPSDTPVPPTATHTRTHTPVASSTHTGTTAPAQPRRCSARPTHPLTPRDNRAPASRTAAPTRTIPRCLP